MRIAPCGQRAAIRRHARGQSLVSMLVGMTVGLIVMGALFGIFISLKTSYRAQGDLARQSSAEMRVMDRLAQVVQTAGFYPYWEYRGVPRADFNAAGVWKQRQAIGGDTGNGPTGDVLRTRFRVHNAETVRDCGGDKLPAANAATMYVQTVHVNASRELVCTVETSTGASRREYRLAAAISRFAIRYGLDRDGDGSVERYADARAVTVAGAWGEVVTVRFDLARTHDVPGGPVEQALTQVVRVANRE